MNLKRILVAALLVPVLSSCIANVPEVQLASPTPEEVKVVPTTTPEVISSTPSLFETNNNCVSLIEDPTLIGSGYLVLLNWSISANDPFQGSGMFTSASTYESVFLDNSYWFPAISPTGKKIAYLDYKESPPELIISTGNDTYIFSWENITYFYWVNDDILAIKEDYEPDTYTLLLDYLSGNIEKIETDFPDMSDFAVQLINPWWGRVTSFNPSLTYVVYPSAKGVELLMLKDQIPVRSVPVTPMHYSPIWSPKGESFLIGFPSGDNAELASLTIDNEVTLLTDFGSIYSSFAISSYSWSPNGQYIAFWISVGDYFNDSEKFLAFIDLVGNELTVTCTSSQKFIYDYMDILVWSPDSRQIATNLYLGNQAISNIIVDVEGLSYRVIPNEYDVAPIGWLTFNPQSK